MNKMNKMYLVLGDWSNDGHGMSLKLLFDVNKSVIEVQEAFKKSCELTGIAFNVNENFTKIKRSFEEKSNYEVAVEYEECELSKEVLSIFKKFDCPQYIIDEYIYEPIEGYANLWFWFVRLSIKNLEHTRIKIKDPIPVINAWDKNLNVSFGYGLFL